MRLRLAALLVLAALPAAAFERLVTFGDSNVDIGRALTEADNWVPNFKVVPPNTVGRRFADGKLLPEFVEEMTGKPIETYGWGGASSGEINRIYRRGLIDAKYTGTLSQIEEYAEGREGADPRALYLIFAGSNDLNVLVPSFAQNKVDETVAEVSRNHETAIRRLDALGATKIAVSTRTARPVLSDAARPADETRAEARNDAAGRQLNAEIRALVLRLDAELGAKVALLDSYAIIRGLIDGAPANGFAPYSEAKEAYCVKVKACEALINFDGAHKTSAVHRELAKALIALFP